MSEDSIFILQAHPEEFIIKVEGSVVVRLRFKKMHYHAGNFIHWVSEVWKLSLFPDIGSSCCHYMIFSSCSHLKAAGDCALVTHKHSSACMIVRAEWLIDAWNCKTPLGEIFQDRKLNQQIFKS